MRKLLPESPMKNGVYSSTFRLTSQLKTSQQFTRTEYQLDTLQIITRGGGKSQG